MVPAASEAVRAEVAKLAHKVGQLAEVDAILRRVDAAAGPKKLRSAGWHAAPPLAGSQVAGAVPPRPQRGHRRAGRRCCPRAAHDLDHQRIRREKVQNSPIWLIAATELWVATGAPNGG